MVKPHHITTGAPEMKLSTREQDNYSLTRLLTAMAEGRLERGASFEAEVAESVAAEAGRDFDPQRVVIDLNHIGTRDMTAAGVSGSNYIVGTDTAATVDMLRPWSVSLQAGITRMGGLVGNVAIPRTTAASTSYWLSDENASISASQPTAGLVNMSAKMAGALIQFSNMMLRVSPVVEAYLRREIFRTTGTLIDQAVFNGSAATTASRLGILNTPNIGTQSGTSLAWAGILNLEQQIADAGTEPTSYITTPAVRELLKARAKASGSDMVWSGDEMNGRPAFATTTLPAATLIAADFSQIVLGQWGGLEIQIAPPSAAGFRAGSLAIRLLTAVDVGVLHPGAVAVSTSIT
jgi:HK97 family phage major capsid protein